jgi:hypothetical protein
MSFDCRLIAKAKLQALPLIDERENRTLDDDGWGKIQFQFFLLN